MRVLALDVGSSSVKAAVLEDETILAKVPEPERFPTDESRPPRVQIAAEEIWNAVARAVGRLGEAVRAADRIALDALSPSCVLLDAEGGPLTPIITHQDRRSVEQAERIEARFGLDPHLRMAGNRPFPGGIGSTTLLWLRENEPQILDRAATVGMATTFLVARLTGARAIDPGNAGFLGLYDHGLRAAGAAPCWNRDLCKPAGIRLDQLPDILDGATVAGRLKAAAARRLGLREGTEVLAGVVDTSAAFLGVGAEPGRLLNSIGTTDVIALAWPRARPHEQLLTRELGAGALWLSVYTVASGGGSLAWAHEALFPDLKKDEFYKLARDLTARPPPAVRFEPFLAGDRMSIRQRKASFEGIDRSVRREDLLRAILEAIALRNAEGMELLTREATPLPDVFVAGGGDWLSDFYHRAWPGDGWRFHPIEDATYKGLARLAAGRFA